MAKTGVKLIANNKKAYHDYFILETYEAGISLAGTEVKSMRMGKCSIKESFIRIENGEVFVYGMHISPYEKGNIFNKDPLRVRKLLLHKQEINKLLGKMKEKGMTLVPLKVYLKGSLVRWRSAWQKERNCMTRGRTLPKKTRQEKHREISKFVILGRFKGKGRYNRDGTSDKKRSEKPCFPDDNRNIRRTYTAADSADRYDKEKSGSDRRAEIR